MLTTAAWATSLAAGPKAKGFLMVPLLVPTAPQASLASAVTRPLSTTFSAHVAAYSYPMIYPDDFWMRNNVSVSPRTGDPWPCVSLAALMSRSTSNARALLDGIAVDALSALGDPTEGSGSAAAWERRVRAAVETDWQDFDEFVAACGNPSTSGVLVTEALVLCGIRDIVGASRLQIRSCLGGHFLLSRAMRSPILAQPAARDVVLAGEEAASTDDGDVLDATSSPTPPPPPPPGALTCCQWRAVKVPDPGASPPAVRLLRLLPLHVVAPLVSPSFFHALPTRVAEWRRTDISLAQALVTGGSVNHGTSCTDKYLRLPFASEHRRHVSVHDPPAVLLPDLLVVQANTSFVDFLDGSSLASQALRHVSRRAVAAHAASWDAGSGTVLPRTLRHAVLDPSRGTWLPAQYAKVADAGFGERGFEESAGAQEAVRMAARQRATCSASRGSAECLKVSMMVPPLDWGGPEPIALTVSGGVAVPKDPPRGGILGDYFARPLRTTGERDGGAIALERVIAALARVGLQHWLTGGSLLGAMRHASPIPWASHELHLGVTRAGDDLVSFLHRSRLWTPLFGLHPCTTLDHGHRKCCDVSVPHVCVYFFLHVVTVGDEGEPTLSVGIPGTRASTATMPITAVFPLAPTTFLVYLDLCGPRAPQAREPEMRTTPTLAELAMAGPNEPTTVLDALGVGHARTQKLCEGRLSHGVRSFSGTGFPCAAYPTTPRHPSHRAAFWGEGFGLDERCGPTLECSRLTPYHHLVTSIATNESVPALMVKRLASYIADWTGLEGGTGDDFDDAPLLEAALRDGWVEHRRVERCGRRLVDVLHARFEDPGEPTRECRVAAHTYQTLVSSWHTVYIGAASCTPPRGLRQSLPAFSTVRLPRTPPRCVARAIAAEVQEANEASSDVTDAEHPLQTLYDPMGIRLPQFSVQRRLYNLLRIFNQVMNEAGVQWWADSGTLLGAVRHGGLIPHDDDADLIILLDSFQRFLHLQPQFEAQGANITRLYFGARVCLIDGYDSWQNPPFLDIFVQDWKPSPTLGNCTAMADSGMGAKSSTMWPQDKEAFCVHNLLPLRRYPFGGTSVWGPADPVPYLDRKFGCAWRDRSTMNFPHSHNCGVARLHAVGLSRGHFAVTPELRIGVPDPDGGVDEVRPPTFEPRACVSSLDGSVQASMAALAPFDLDSPLLYWSAERPIDGEILARRLRADCTSVGVAFGIGTDSAAKPSSLVEPAPLRAVSGPAVVEVLTIPEQQSPSLWLDQAKQWVYVTEASEVNATGWIIASVPPDVSKGEMLVARIRATGEWDEPLAVRHFKCMD